MEELEKRTGGIWKPSPGSVYPLLSWLQENNYTKEIPGEKGDYVKRYMLTAKGEEFLEKQTKLREDVSKKLGFFAPPFLWFSSQPKLLGAIHKPIRRFIMSMMDLRMLGNELTDQDLEEIGELLNSTALRIEEITERLKEQNR